MHRKWRSRGIPNDICRVPLRPATPPPTQPTPPSLPKIAQTCSSGPWTSSMAGWSVGFPRACLGPSPRFSGACLGPPAAREQAGLFYSVFCRWLVPGQYEPPAQPLGCISRAAAAAAALARNEKIPEADSHAAWLAARPWASRRLVMTASGASPQRTARRRPAPLPAAAWGRTGPLKWRQSLPGSHLRGGLQRSRLQ
jgi:hypothetical protein